jgi:transcriptional regulator with XRE-family HTH domain
MENDTYRAEQPFHTTLAQRMAELGITDEALANQLGYSKPNVIAMMRMGRLRVSVQKTQALAAALQMPASKLFEALMHEGMPEVLETMRAVYEPMVLTPTEINLIKHLRRNAKGEAYTPVVMSGKGVIALVTSTVAQ